LDVAVGYFACTRLFEDGQYIISSDPGVFERQHHDVTATIDYNAGLPAPDWLMTIGHMCLSERALTAFHKAKLNLSPQFQWVPVRVLRKSGKMVARYWWAKCDEKGAMKEYDVLDLENAKYTVYPPEALNKSVSPGTIVYNKVSDWVLRSEQIGSLDFFYGCRVRWYGSPRLKAVVERNRLKGFYFTPVALSFPA
jgi:hypothetical protein